MADHIDTNGRGSRASRGAARVCAPAEVWAAVRRDYLAGVAAAECCRLHGVGLTALRNRAGREGWRRADQAWTPPGGGLDPWDEGVMLEEKVGGDLDRVDPTDLSWVAWRRMMRAVLRGDAAETLRWRRVRLAMDEETAELDRLWAQDDALRSDWHDRQAASAVTEPVDVDDVDDVDGVFPAQPG